MNFLLDESQELLAQTAQEFFDAHGDMDRLRRYRDEGHPTGFSWDLWREMAELGFVAAQVPPSYGGIGMGFADTVLIFEAAGRHLLPEPLLSNLLGVQALVLGGTESQKSAWLPRVSAGEALVTVADRETHQPYDPQWVETRADRTESGFRLSGRKTHVLDGHVAEAIVVPARTAGNPGDRDGITLFLVGKEAAGLRCTPLARIDGRGAADMEFDGVELTPDSVLGDVDGGAPLLGSILDRARVAIAAEMLGAASWAMDVTIGYLKERQQFGAPIGSFQALQHRASRMFVSVTLARSAVIGAARVLENGTDDVPRAASLAKAQAGSTLLHIAKEGIQMHGGVGATDEFDIGFYLKRGQAAEATFGDSSWHRSRWATLGGY